MRALSPGPPEYYILKYPICEDLTGETLQSLTSSPLTAPSFALKSLHNRVVRCEFSVYLHSDRSLSELELKRAKLL